MGPRVPTTWCHWPSLKPAVTIVDVDLAKLEFYAPKKEKRLPAKGERINLVWQYVGQITPAGPDRAIPGIDVLAPTWFDLIVDGDGAVENNGVVAIEAARFEGMELPVKLKVHESAAMAEEAEYRRLNEKIGEQTMEIELLREKIRIMEAKDPLGLRRSRK